MQENIEHNKSLIYDYFLKNSDIFTAEEKDFSISLLDFDWDNLDIIPYFAREVYDELGILPNNHNIYLGFCDFIRETLNVSDKKILEVGGGVLPRLGERLSVYLKDGSLTIYDPRLSLKKNSTDVLKLVRQRFSYQTNVSEFDLIVGLMPCDAAEVIVDVATNNKKDFMIALCEGGEHGEDFDFYQDDDEWRHSVILSARRKVEKMEMGKLKVKYLHSYGNPYPIIYNSKN